MKSLQLNGLLLAAALLTSCEEVIDYKLNSTDEKLVVEGLVTDQPGPYTVRLTSTKGYLDQGRVPSATAGLVTITDVEAGVTDTLRASTATAGLYLTTPRFPQGQIGHHYRLRIVREGQEYTAESEIKRILPLDSLSFKYKTPQTDAVSDSGYYTTAYFREAAGRGDYYRFLIYQNRRWRNRSEVAVIDDELYDGNYGDPEIGYNINPRDTVTVELRSIDKAAYDFYIGLTNAQLNTGTPFDSPPANAPTNVRGNRVIGLFTACAARRATRVAPPKPR